MEDKDKTSSSSAASSSTKSFVSSRPSKQKLKDLIAERRKHKMDQNVAQPVLMDPFEAVNRFKRSPYKLTGYVEEESPEHYCLWDPLYPENAERVACPKRRLEELKLKERCAHVTSLKYPDEVYLKRHTRDLFEKLKSVEKIPKDKLEEFSSKYDSVYFTQDTFKCSLLAAQAAITLTIEVAKGTFKNGFALIRPPGHHAMTDEFCGYCYINNVAVAAQMAIDEGYSRRVLIIDHDVHHGQGTQRMFYDRDDVLYFSIHRYEHGNFWPNLRESDSDYIGVGKGKGYNINIPLNATGLTDADYMAIILNILLPVAYEFNPDLILVSAGYDCAIGCPEGEMMVTPHFFSHLITLLSGLAQGKIVVCLEGGYFPESVAEGVSCTLKALLGDICHPISATPEVHPGLIDVINNTKFFLRNHWECFKNDPIFSYPKSSNLRECLDVYPDSEHLSVISYKYVPQEVTVYETTGFYPIQSTDEIKKFTKMIMDLREDYEKGRHAKPYVGYVYDEQLLKHKSSDELGKCPEKPERLLEILKCFESFGLVDRLRKVKLYDGHEEEWIKKIHEEAYLQKVFENKDVVEKPDWFFNSDTTDCIKTCVSCVLSLSQNIHQGSVRSGVAVVRPPGHHACFDKASGFCYVNNVVVTAEYLIKSRNYKRILIVDFDIHHGNGTQNLTYNRDDILYISIHRFDEGKYFPFSMEADYNYVGSGEGEGYNVNIPFNKGNKTDHDYWTVWLKLVLPLAYSYNPEFVIISAGFDAAYYDPLGSGYKLSPEIYAHFIQTLKPLASGKLLLVLEGGYHLESTALSMTMCVKALLDDVLPVPKFNTKVTGDTCEAIQKVLSVHKKKWKMLQVNKKIANFSCTNEEKITLKESLKNEMEHDGTIEHLRQMFKNNVTFTDI